MTSVVLLGGGDDEGAERSEYIGKPGYRTEDEDGLPDDTNGRGEEETDGIDGEEFETERDVGDALIETEVEGEVDTGEKSGDEADDGLPIAAELALIGAA